MLDQRTGGAQVKAVSRGVGEGPEMVEGDSECGRWGGLDTPR